MPLPFRVFAMTAVFQSWPGMKQWFTSAGMVPSPPTTSSVATQPSATPWKSSHRRGPSAYARPTTRMQTVGSTPIDPRASRVLAIVFVTVFLDLVGFGIVIPLFPFYVESMGGTARTVGFLFACFSFTQLVATPLLGRLSDRVGRRRVILVSLLGNAVAMVLFAIATSQLLLPLLFASRILAGGTAGNLAACQATVADVTSGEQRTRGMGRLGAGIGLGLVLGPVIGSTLSHFGPWAPPLGAAALATADFVAAFFLMPETREIVPLGKIAVKGSAALAAVLGQRRLLTVLGLYFCTFLYMTTMQVALALLAKERLDWGEKQIGAIFGGYGAITFTVQGILISRISRLYGPIRTVTFAALLSAAGLVTIAFAHQPISLLAGIFVLALGLGITQPLLSSIASEYAAAESRGAVLGFAQSAGGLARTIGPTLSGFLYVGFGAGAPFAAGAVVAVVGAALTITLWKTPA